MLARPLARCKTSCARPSATLTMRVAAAQRGEDAMAPQRTRGITALGIVITLMSTWLLAGSAASGGPRPLGSPTAAPDDDGDGIANADEREIAFVSNRHGNKEIYVMNA